MKRHIPVKPKRRRFKFRPVPKPPIDKVKLVQDFVEAARGLENAREGLDAAFKRLREAVGQFAELDVSDWDTEQILRYAEGVIRTRRDDF